MFVRQLARYCPPQDIFVRDLNGWVNGLLNNPLNLDEAFWTSLDNQFHGWNLNWLDKDSCCQDITQLIQVELFEDMQTSRDLAYRLMLLTMYLRLQKRKFPSYANRIQEAAEMATNIFLKEYERQKPA